MATETSIHKYLLDNWKTIFPHYKLLESEVPIIGSYSKKIIGYGDILFRHIRGGAYYLGEIKYRHERDSDSFSLWNSFKSIGYAKAYELSSVTRKKVIPVVILDKKLMSNDIREILFNLGVHYITFEDSYNTKERWKFEYYLVRSD